MNQAYGKLFLHDSNESRWKGLAGMAGEWSNWSFSRWVNQLIKRWTEGLTNPKIHGITFIVFFLLYFIFISTKSHIQLYAFTYLFSGEINTSVIKEILMKLDEEMTEDDVDEMIAVSW